jgi:hypothetical protein
MKDPYGLADSGLPPELAAQMMGLSKREALAQALLAQSQEELQAHPVKGRFQGAITPIQGAAKVVQALLAQKGVKDVSKEREEVAASRQRATKDALSQYEQARGADPRGAIRAAASNPLISSHPLIGMDVKENEARVVGPSLMRGDGTVVGTAPQRGAAPRQDPEAVRLAQIASDPNRPQAERDAAAAALKKATTSGPLTQVNVSSGDKGPNFKDERVLRDEFEDRSKSFIKIRDAYSQVRDALSGDITAPATLAGATKFMKMLDPESVVRESELNMALKSTGLMDRFMNLHNTVSKGQVLTPTQAQEIQRIAGVLYQTAEAAQKKTSDYYTALANDYKLDAKRIVRDLTIPLKREEPKQSRRATDQPGATLKFDEQGNPVQ